MPRLNRCFTRDEVARRRSITLDELRTWRAWELGRSRCPLCVDLDAEDWWSVCDCFLVDDLCEQIHFQVMEEFAIMFPNAPPGHPYYSGKPTPSKEEMYRLLFDQVVINWDHPAMAAHQADRPPGV